MKRIFGLIALSGIAALAVAVGTESVLLSSFATSIHDAKSLKTEYVMQEIGGGRDEYSVALKKPNLARIDSPDQLVVADGKQITTFSKKNKTFFKQPETPELLNGLFAADSVRTWAGFFNPGAYSAVAAQDLGPTHKGDKDYDAVKTQTDKVGAKTVTYYLDQSDKIARQVEFKATHGTDNSTQILKTRSLDINGMGDDSLFTFAAPAGASEVSLADMMAGKWYTSLAEAEKIASAQHAHIFLDFMASWCGPCKLLQAQVLDSDDFKKAAAAKHLVLCRIDIDLNPDIASKYAITAIPVQAIVDQDGNMISQTLGYANPSTFYSWLNGAAKDQTNAR